MLESGDERRMSMTIQKAIEQLEDLKRDRENFAKTDEPDGEFVKDIQAIDIALKALKEIQNIKFYKVPVVIDTCIFCGEIIPEGRQVCPKCEKGEMHDKV